MKRPLDEQAVRRWISDQRAAQERILSERVRFLLELSPEKALRLYLSLWASTTPASRIKHDRPSPLLLSMRRAMTRAESRHVSP
ncbi:MAG: hypothetical protein R6U88_02795 [Candidatus Bipolaricaulota bacterium]